MAAVIAGISDEQDFNAVSSRETIESDAERIARNRGAICQVVQPTALPQRPGDTGPNIVRICAGHQPMRRACRSTSRSAIRLYVGQTRPARSIASPDQAQEAFLEAGGPERDRKGLDPDGDGFACAWDPRPFRTALQ